MKTYTDYLVIKTRERYEIRDITDEVARIVAASAVDDGMVLKRHAHYREQLAPAQNGLQTSPHVGTGSLWRV